MQIAKKLVMFAAGNPLELRHLRSINGLYRMDGARKGDFGTNTTPTPVGYNLLNGTLVGSCTAIQQCSSRLDYTDVYLMCILYHGLSDYLIYG